MSTRTISADYLARVEGESALYVRITGGRVDELQLKVFEPPRFFEALLRGRSYAEAPDITSRICGICPVAYQMSAVHALERAFGVHVDGQLRELRRLLYCGEWIESHALHIFLLHAPDFLGYQDAIAMAKDHPEIVQRGLRMKKAGNRIVALLGGREVHPINARVGGFYSLPARHALTSLAEALKRGRDDAVETVRWAATLPFPDFAQDYELVSLRHPTEYPMNEGRLVSNKGLDVDVSKFEEHFTEEHVAYTNALHSTIRGRGAYFVGPMARFALNYDRLSPLAREMAREVGLGPQCRNPFQSIVVRAIETLYAFDEALRIVVAYQPPDRASMEVVPRTQAGWACTEAPRGILYHRYRVDEAGRILEANIVPPTAQNQKTIESDLRTYVERHLHLPDEALTWQCEQAIRNYDPCISCATHFLKLEIDRQ